MCLPSGWHDKGAIPLTRAHQHGEDFQSLSLQKLLDCFAKVNVLVVFIFWGQSAAEIRTTTTGVLTLVLYGRSATVVINAFQRKIISNRSQSSFTDMISKIKILFLKFIFVLTRSKDKTQKPFLKGISLKEW